MKNILKYHDVDYRNLTKIIQNPEMCMPGSSLIENTLKALRLKN